MAVGFTSEEGRPWVPASNVYGLASEVYSRAVPEISAEARDVLDFWFGPSVRPDAVPTTEGLWWKKSDRTDAEIQTRFKTALSVAQEGGYIEWEREPKSCLALIILLDQFSRNAYRGRPEAFQQDARAVRLCLEGLDRGWDSGFSPFERVFFYMPLEHSEDIEIQERCVRTFQKLAEEVPESLREMFLGYVGYAERHRDIVQQFGRFPHRNEILKRPSTDEELAFLKTPNSSF